MPLLDIDFYILLKLKTTSVVQYQPNCNKIVCGCICVSNITGLLLGSSIHSFPSKPEQR
jgi:hypothetical protein